MNHGKHVAIEVPAAITLQECWDLVDTSERTQQHCMMLENCCYGETEMLVAESSIGVDGESRSSSDVIPPPGQPPL
jgi:hypothetical protein